jgi:hypothetical protein
LLLGRLRSEGLQFMRTHLHNNQTKWTRDLAQQVERLLCNLQALSSNPSPAKNKQKHTKIN